MDSMQSQPDVPMLVTSATTKSERRITPSWSIAQLKTRLEPITGIPASAQRLTIQGAPVEAVDEESVQLAAYPLQAYAEIYVHDTRPAAARVDFSDVSAVPKYVMPENEYESRSDSVLAWKKSQKLGRFDPDAPSLEQQKILELEQEIKDKDLRVSRRCRLLPSSTPRHGEIRYVGLISQLPGPGPWVGVALDEPTGKNDGSVKGSRYFTCNANCGVFVRPERVEAGDFGIISIDDDLEEI
ncbi:hypothetical protein EJ05DRAFT_478914 [Pseudovirgaria hyperparasitica]|uniref:CAP-Gly domain-containing protein n=1 Tax=Pseudovirgaria hyperparasitica TaxID=470096 RepID=A0A6A6W0K5_9PEZI|nr:uncharacterized protein EJ05DRAFT_478914 [Pseudovirgaria hyperparasitica]KAF2755107.1 hypothetical protein EJ05DRAFT_478914 [Pseudovirgaria hyperparasitica]